MAIINMPFQKNHQPYRRNNINSLPLEQAKNMILNVSYVEFKNACIEAYVQHFLIDLYYMHYLAMLGDTVRARNFKLDLEQRNLDVAKLVNYNKEERFNFGSVLHTCVSWNNNTTMIEFLKDECNGDFGVEERLGFDVCSMNWQEGIYTNPFLDILGHGERPFDKFNLYRRNPHDFDIMDRFLKTLEEEEEQEENIEVNVAVHPLFMRRNAVVDNIQRPQLERQNGVIFDEQEDINNAPDYIPLPVFDDNNLPEVPENEAFEHVELQPRRLFHEENEPMEQEQPVQEDKMNNKLVTIIKNLFPNDNEVVEDVIETMKALEVFTVEDFIDSKLEEGDLEMFGIKDEEVLDTIWTYIEKHSPNFVNGIWIN
jgi:hypothetical protein